MRHGFIKRKENGSKSLPGKIRSRYAVSAVETGEQDLHQVIVIGMTVIAAHFTQADSQMDNILTCNDTTVTI